MGRQKINSAPPLFFLFFITRRLPGAHGPQGPMDIQGPMGRPQASMGQWPPKNQPSPWVPKGPRIQLAARGQPGRADAGVTPVASGVGVVSAGGWRLAGLRSMFFFDFRKMFGFLKKMFIFCEKSLDLTMHFLI